MAEQYDQLVQGDTLIGPGGDAALVRIKREDGLVRLEDQADWLLAEIGIEFRDFPRALDLWREAGADVLVAGTRIVAIADDIQEPAGVEVQGTASGEPVLVS